MKKGFTLIELLVVITIMSILIGVAAVNYRKTIQLGRDGKRKSDIAQIRQYLETYRSEMGTYPSNLNLLIPSYAAALPTDPQGGSYAYVPGGTGTILTYSLCSALENNPNQTLSRCTTASCGSVTCNYETTNP